MTDLFLSYSRRDKDFVQKLHKALDEQGRDIWVDWEDIPLTADWLQEIYDGIDAANAFVFVLTPDSAQSEVCGWEVKYAVESGKRLIPIVHREVLEQDDREKIHPAINAHNWLFFREEDDFDATFKMLTDALDTDLDHTRDHTRLLVRAKEWDGKERSNGFLLTGDELTEAETWLSHSAGKRPEPVDLHHEYIFVSRKAATRRQQQLIVVSVAVAIVSLVLAVAAVIGFTDANHQRNIANDQRDIAERNAAVSERLALAASAQFELAIANQDQALALALEAVRIDDPPDAAVRVLEEAAYGPGTRMILEGHEARVITVAFAPTGDIAASGDANGDVFLWDLTTGEHTATLSGHSDWVRRVIFTADGTHLFSASDDTTVILWELASGEPVQTFAGGHDAYMRGFDLSPDETRLITGADDNKAIVWDVASGNILHTYDEFSDWVRTVAFSPDGRWIAAGSDDRVVVVWDAETYEEVSRMDIDGYVTGVDFNADGSQIVVSSGDKEVRVFDVETGTILRTFTGHLEWVTTARFSADGNYVLSGANDTTVRLWSMLNGRQLRLFTGHTGEVMAVEFSPDGTQALTASYDGTLRLIDLSNGAQTAQISGHHTDDISVVALNADGTRAFAGSWDDTLSLYDMTDYTLIALLETTQGDVNDAVFTPDGTRIVIADDAGLVVYDAVNGEQLGLMQGVHERWVMAVAVSPDSRYALSGAFGDDAVLWDLETMEPLHHFTAFDGYVSGVDFSGDGTRFLTTSQDGFVRIWDAASYELVAEYEFETKPWNGYFQPGGGLIALSIENRVVLIDAVTGATVRELVGHSGSINSALSFSADGSLLITGSSDGALRLWEVATGQEMRAIVTDSAVRSVVLSVESHMAISGGEDRVLRIWEVSVPDVEETRAWTFDNRHVRALSCEEQAAYHLVPATACDSPDETAGTTDAVAAENGGA